MKDLRFVPATIRGFVAGCAARYPDVERILLYGSRARGDAGERSDFDLAVVAPGMTHAAWSRFALEMEEELPTLCGVDLLRLDEKTARDLRARITREGVVLYERAA